MRVLGVVMLALAVMAAAPVQAQAQAQADSMQVLRQEMQKDKKLVVQANLPLTDAEAKAFWPIYEDYQKALHRINDRLATMLVTYGKQYGEGNISDKEAMATLERYYGIEEEEMKLRRSFLPRLAKVLPGKKVARYMQIENKIRALVKYELAGEVPLVK